MHRIGILFLLGLILSGCQHPPPAFREDVAVRGDYASNDLIFNVWVVPVDDGYQAFVTEPGGTFLLDFPNIDRRRHVAAAKSLLPEKCVAPELVSEDESFGFVGFPQTSVGLIARFRCS